MSKKSKKLSMWTVWENKRATLCIRSVWMEFEKKIKESELTITTIANSEFFFVTKREKEKKKLEKLMPSKRDA